MKRLTADEEMIVQLATLRTYDDIRDEHGRLIGRVLAAGAVEAILEVLREARIEVVVEADTPVCAGRQPPTAVLQFLEEEARGFRRYLEMKSRPARRSRGTGASFERFGSGLPLSDVISWIETVGESLKGDPVLAWRRQQLIRDALAPVIRNILTVLRPDDSDADRLQAAGAIHEEIEQLIKPGERALTELHREVQGRNRLALKYGEQPRYRDEAEMHERIRGLLFVAVEEALPVPVHQVQQVRQVIGRAVNGLFRRDLLGPGWKQRLGQVLTPDGHGSAGLVIEGHQDWRRRGAIPCIHCGRSNGQPPFRCACCDKETTSRNAVLCPVCGQSTGEPPFTCPQCNIAVPRDYRPAPPTRRAVTAEFVERTAGRAREEIESQVHAEIEFWRLLEKAKEALTAAYATQREREVGLAFIKTGGSMVDAAVALSMAEATARVLLSRLRRKNPHLTVILDPIAWRN